VAAFLAADACKSAQNALLYLAVDLFWSADLALGCFHSILAVRQNLKESALER
jgi:hypothetical protein